MYTTQMDAARQGIITPQMKIVAEKERMDAEEIRSLVAKGQVIIPCNKNHKALHPSGVGARLTTKINVNLGVSRDWKDVDMEYEKVRSAVEMGAEAIMDLSSYGDTRSFRRKLTADCPAMIGTVPIYDAVVYYHKPLAQITAEEYLRCNIHHVWKLCYFYGCQQVSSLHQYLYLLILPKQNRYSYFHDK